LEEAYLKTLTTAKPGLPRLLPQALSSTPPIESALSIAKPKLKRVKNWKSGKDQGAHWSASVLNEAEKRLRTIRGFKQLPLLINELKNLTIAKDEKVI